MNKNLLIASVVSIVCACVVAGAVLVWAPPCSGSLELTNGNMVPMRCVYTGKIALLIALLLVVASAAQLVAKRSFAVVVVALSLALVLLPLETPISIGVCKSAEMACHATAMWLYGAGGVSAVAALVCALVNPDRKRVTE